MPLHSLTAPVAETCSTPQLDFLSVVAALQHSPPTLLEPSLSHAGAHAVQMDLLRVVMAC